MFCRLVIAFATLASIASSTPSSAGETTIVPNRVIYPGELIAADAIEEVAFDRGNRNLPPLVMSADEIEGKVARRTLLPGRLIQLGALREPWAVEAGKEVTVLFEDGALSISATAVPLANAAVGDLVKLRNIDSGAVFSGTVMADGSVRVGAS
jgi:flagellar basal body P-ring formation protein FlgA